MNHAQIIARTANKLAIVRMRNAQAIKRNKGALALASKLAEVQDRLTDSVAGPKYTDRYVGRILVLGRVAR